MDLFDPSAESPEQSAPSSPVPLGRSDGDDVTAADFHERFGEDIRRVLDVSEWGSGTDLSAEYTRIEQEVREAVEREDVHQRRIRTHVFPKLSSGTDLPPNAGLHPARMELIERIYPGLLFNGAVEACAGTVQIHDTLPLTIYQIGVTLGSYAGDDGTWCQRLFRRDLRCTCDNPEEEILELFRRRSQRDQADEEGAGELIQKALLTYAERAILLRRSNARWRLGHGNPVTYELLTGGGILELMVAGTTAVRELVERQQRFVFVASEPRDRLLMSIGHALRPMEFFIVDTLDRWLGRWLRQHRFVIDVGTDLPWDDERIPAAEWIPRFIKRVASRVVVGLFRASHYAPAQLFYAHIDHADLAAHIVLADSRLQEHRGFPMLIDKTRHICATELADALQNLADSAYAAAGEPWRYPRRSLR